MYDREQYLEDRKSKQLRSKRSFGGKVSEFKDSAERSFENAHLKAYLKGQTRFRYGFTGVIGTASRQPLYHLVKVN